jgi:hypothetical protein
MEETQFNEFRQIFNEPNRAITLAQLRALPTATLDRLITESNLSIPHEGQARLFHQQPAGNILIKKVFNLKRTDFYVFLILFYVYIPSCRHALTPSEKRNTL